MLLHLLRLMPFLVGGHRQLALENLALRQQLAVYQRTAPRPRLRTTDRLFWAGLARVWTGWRQALVIVSPDTVLRWQRRRFHEYWTRLSGRSRGGRPPVSTEIAALVRTMAHGESPVGCASHPRRAPQARHRRRRTHCLPPHAEAAPPALSDLPTFLDNHVRDLVSIDFFTVPTARLRVLFVFVVLAHHRRRVVHFTSPSIPSPPGRLSSSWTPSRRTPRHAIFSAIATALMAMRFGDE